MNRLGWHWSTIAQTKKSLVVFSRATAAPLPLSVIQADTHDMIANFVFDMERRTINIQRIDRVRSPTNSARKHFPRLPPAVHPTLVSLSESE
jgi:hypothetical protein